MRKSFIKGKKNSSKIFLWGWFCQGNSGDDALFTAVTNVLNMALPDAVTLIQVSPKEHLPPGLSSVKFIPPIRRFKGDILFKNIFTLFKTDLLVWGGGSTMSDTDGVRLSSLRYKKLICRIARLLGRPIFFYALGLGPLVTKEGRSLAREILNMANFVQVRDRVSYDLCHEIGVTAQVERAFDPAVLIPDLLGCQIDIPPEKTSSLFRIGIAPSASSGSVPNTNLEQSVKISHFVNGIKRISSHTNIEVVAIQMCANTRNNDIDICNQILDSLRGICQTSLIRYNPDPSKMMAEIAMLDCVLAERLHAGIFSYTVGIPFAVIPYHGKCHAFAQDIGLPKCCILDPMFTSDEVESLLLALLKNEKRWQPALPIDDAKTQAQRGDESLVDKIREAML